MPFLSIRTLNVLLVVSCVVVVGTLCTTLTLLSGDRALDDTRVARDESVHSAFAVGEDSVLSVTEQYLKQVSTGAKNQVTSFFAVTHNYLQALCTEMNTADPAVIDTWDYMYSKRAMLWNGVVTHSEFDGLSILTKDYKYVGVIEASLTISRGPDEYHHYWIGINNGTAYDAQAGLPAKYRTIMGQTDAPGTGNLYGMWTNRSNAKVPCSSHAPAVLSNGKILEAPCAYPLGDVIAAVFKGTFGIFPTDTVYNSGMTSYGTYVGIVVKCEYQNRGTGERLGMVSTGADLRKISRFLASMDLGQAGGSLGRVFLVVRGSYFTKSGVLAGASHGKEFGYVTDNYFGPLLTRAAVISPMNSTDLYVSGAASILGQNVTVNGTQMLRYEQLFLHQRTETVQLEANRVRKTSTSGMLVCVATACHCSCNRVDVFDNHHGLNWYIVALVDREYVLGRVARAVAATRQQVMANEAKVTDDLDKARQVLYIVVVISGLVPLALTVLFVFRITEPLMLLMQDMSHVAVMNLEAVDADRPPSMLSEVRGMETSFKQMLENLVEYRQYLPQSVLVDTSTSEEQTCPLEEVCLESSQRRSSSSNCKQSVISRNQSTVAPQRTAQLFGATLNMKSVSLLVANLQEVNTLRDTSVLADTVASYLEPIVLNSRKYRGIVDDVSGDKVTVSFNTSITTAAHKVRGVDLGHNLLTEWRNLKVNLAVCVRQHGCTGMKKYCVVGNVASNVRAVERTGRSWAMQFLCDGSVALEARQEFLCQALVMACMEGGRVTTLYRVRGKSETENDEWMYQLEKNEAQCIYKPLNEAVTCIYAGELRKAESHLRGTTETCPVVTALMKHLRESSTAPPPIRLFGPTEVVPGSPYATLEHLDGCE